jgi:hypothetical protein
MPHTLSLGLADAVRRLHHASAEISSVYQARRPEHSAPVTPEQLAESLGQFLSTAQKLDSEEGKTGPIYRDDVSLLGDHGLTLLVALGNWVEQMGLNELREDLDAVALAGADWVMRHDGELRTLEPLVNALAAAANHAQQPPELEALENFMGRVLHACSNPLKQDLEKTNPGRPWRLLHLNRGIVATRAHNPELMEQVFDDLVRYLPEDAPEFFTEGMQQMAALDYPPHVRRVMSRYFDQWAHRTVH